MYDNECAHEKRKKEKKIKRVKRLMCRSRVKTNTRACMFPLFSSLNGNYASLCMCVCVQVNRGEKRKYIIYKDGCWIKG